MNLLRALFDLDATAKATRPLPVSIGNGRSSLSKISVPGARARNNRLAVYGFSNVPDPSIPSRV